MTQCKTIAVDLAKDVYEIGFANCAHRIVQRKRLNRAAFRKLLATQPAAVIVMEACGTAHFWGRFAIQQGHQVKILPAQYVRPYRRRNKTDQADVSALVEANRCADIRPVPVRSVDQQQTQQLHRVRSLCADYMMARHDKCQTQAEYTTATSPNRRETILVSTCGRSPYTFC